ncbi:anti-sigma factor [Gottfriedia acidiceleris]|uniref:anti-sigma factor n=1 Tax=Gottfriedia acidiceleris TaxID=371036 RepID=UPI0013ECC4DD|nr:anti-sigma factor [Gottfriedia acidiceleris]
MDENFREKLEAYTNGKLSESEKIQLENELDKLEIYQSYLDEIMQGDDSTKQKNNNFNEKALIKKGIWKARIQNALTALSILLLIGCACWSITTIFYSWGEPDRASNYSEIIRTSFEATHPNVTVNDSIQSGILKLYIDGELNKQLGDGQKNIGEVKSSFFFGLPTINISKQVQPAPFFIYPEQQKSIQIDNGFKRLEHLPEGTVSELYISFSDYLTTDATLKLLEGKNLLPAWFAVDTGIDKNRSEWIEPSLGFPYYGFNLQKNEKVISKEKSGNGFVTTEITGSVNLGLESYGDAAKRNKEFLDVLDLMNSNKLISQNVASFSKQRLQEKTNYIKRNGVRIYGVVVTGPTKELLKLQKEKWVGKASVGDVAFWNWNESK